MSGANAKVEPEEVGEQKHSAGSQAGEQVDTSVSVEKDDSENDGATVGECHTDGKEEGLGSIVVGLAEDLRGSSNELIKDNSPSPPSSPSKKSGLSDWRLVVKVDSISEPVDTPPRKRRLKAAVSQYYDGQNSLIKAYRELLRHDSISSNLLDEYADGESDEKEASKSARSDQANEDASPGRDDDGNGAVAAPSNAKYVGQAIGMSFAANILLFVIKLAAAITSGSLSVVASTVDSVLDLLAGLVIWATMRMVRQRDPVQYPQGKTRLEPLGVIIFSCIMSVSMMSLMQESIGVIVRKLSSQSYTLQSPSPSVTPSSSPLLRGSVSPSSASSNPLQTPELDVFALVVLGVTVAIKFFLLLYCRWAASLGNGSASVNAYAEDHRNDVLANTFVIACLVLASLYDKTLWWLDPAGAVLICFYVVYMWVGTAKEQVQRLTGISAEPAFLNQLTYLAVNHDERVVAVDTVRAYHFGTALLVEVDLVLPPSMELKEAHDIGESLQIKLEKLEEVERAFVHLDWEWDHAPEHKRV